MARNNGDAIQEAYDQVIAIYCPMSNSQILKRPLADWQLYKQIRLESLREATQAFGSSCASSAQLPDSHL